MPSSVARHQQQHRLHRFFFAVALAVVFVSLLGIGIAVLQVSGTMSVASVSGGAATTNLSSLITTAPARVIADDIVPSGQLTYTASSSIALPSTNFAADARASIFLSNDSIPDGGTASTTQSQTTIPQFNDDRPTFTGYVSVPYAIVFLELHATAPHIITTSVTADEHGHWSWQPAQPVTHEGHTLVLSVFDSGRSTLVAKLQLQFIVGSALPVLPDTGLVTRVPVPVRSLIEQHKALIDVRARIVGVDELHQIHPGDRIFVQVSLVNIGTPGYLTDTQVQYRLLDLDNKPLFTQLETVSVATQTSFLKIFTTNITMPESDYHIDVSMQYGDAESQASDSFRIRGEPVLPLTPSTKVNVSVFIQIFSLILAIAVLITYFEYKQLERLRRTIHQVTEDDLKKAGLIS